MTFDLPRLFSHNFYIHQVNVVNGGGYIVTLAVCPSVRRETEKIEKIIDCAVASSLHVASVNLFDDNCFNRNIFDSCVKS